MLSDVKLQYLTDSKLSTCAAMFGHVLLRICDHVTSCCDVH